MIIFDQSVEKLPIRRDVPLGRINHKVVSSSEEAREQQEFFNSPKEDLKNYDTSYQQSPSIQYSPTLQNNGMDRSDLDKFELVKSDNLHTIQ